MSKKPWTFSTLEAFTTCPKQFYHLRIAKDVIEPPSEALLWGSRVHEAFELRIKDGTPLPEGMTQWEGLAKKIEKLEGTKYIEHPMAIDEDFKPAPWDESWARGIADIIVVNGQKALVLDYKTGKKKLTNQLALYAVFVFIHFPQVMEVKAGFVWLKERSINRESFKREQIPIIMQSFIPQVCKLEAAKIQDKWPARPSGLCKKWCSVLSCSYNGKNS